MEGEMTNGNPEPIKIINHAAVGRKVVEWVMNPETRPKNLAELEQQLAGAVATPLPQNWKGIQFIDANSEVLLFRLPPKDMVQNSLRRSQGMDPAAYQLPSFYECDAGNLAISAEELFYSRVGDYSTGLCR